MQRQNMKYKLNYTETREKIHEILLDFLDRELECSKNNEFDFEFMEFRTDDILNLIKNQGGNYAEWFNKRIKYQLYWIRRFC